MTTTEVPQGYLLIRGYDSPSMTYHVTLFRHHVGPSVKGVSKHTEIKRWTPVDRSWMPTTAEVAALTILVTK